MGQERKEELIVILLDQSWGTRRGAKLWYTKKDGKRGTKEEIRVDFRHPKLGFVTEYPLYNEHSDIHIWNSEKWGWHIDFGVTSLSPLIFNVDVLSMVLFARSLDSYTAVFSRREHKVAMFLSSGNFQRFLF